jgi:hypothetical protein
LIAIEKEIVSRVYLRLFSMESAGRASPSVPVGPRKRAVQGGPEVFHKQGRMKAEDKVVPITAGGTSDAPPHPQPKERFSWFANWDSRTNMIAVVLMALATLGSSWSAYQSSLWDGIQIFHLNDAAKLSREAGAKATIAGQQRSLDTALFVQCARDFYEGRWPQVQFVLARMRPDFRQAVEAWLATQPGKNPNAPSTPFVMPQYRQPLDDEVSQLEKKSGEVYSQARYANLTSDTYTLLGVIYTSALFLSGLISGFDQKQARRALLALSVLMLVSALTIMVGQPIAHRG